MRALTASVEEAMTETRVQMATAQAVASDETLFQKIVPPTIVGFAVVANVAWIGLLGYGLVTLIRLAFL